MPGREIDLRLYRVIVRYTMLLSLGLVVLGLYRLLQADWTLGVLAILLGVATLLPSQYYRVRPDPEAERLLVLLTKKDCLLCLEAREVLRTVTADLPFTVQETDIAEHRYLRKRFKNDVPVVLWQGDVLARLKVDPDELRRRLLSIQERQKQPL